MAKYKVGDKVNDMAMIKLLEYYYNKASRS